MLAAVHMGEAGLGRIEVNRLASLPEDFREAFFGCFDYAIIGSKL